MYGGRAPKGELCNKVCMYVCNKICKLSFCVPYMVFALMFTKLVEHVIESLQKEETSLKCFPAKDDDVATTLFDKQHESNGTSLEVNKIGQSFYLGRHAQQKFA